ncbi:MAG: DNA polymerase III subunit gamma/tau [Planctomycetes bacterium]|nr:DNA polymerase III subunit gamma/tau [Planctomycetota bacterium]
MSQSAYQSLALKYRPRTFSDVVGQAAVVDSLRGAVQSGRVHPVYLFCGPRGVGKTSLARIFAKALNCPRVHEGDPCGECEVCSDIARGSHLDVVEIDGASNNSVDDVRRLQEGVGAVCARQGSRFKVYIVDEVHMLSGAAFNALLKTLEEPPPHARFVFATTEPHKVMSTVLSRCQRFDFRRVCVSDLLGRLNAVCAAEGLEPEEGALAELARASDGSLRDSVVLLDQVYNLGGRRFGCNDVAESLGKMPQDEVDQVLNAVDSGDDGIVLQAVHHLVERGLDLGAFLDGGIETLRLTLVAGACGQDGPLADEDPGRIQDWQARAKRMDADTILARIEVLVEARRALRRGEDGRLSVELALLTLSRLGQVMDVAHLADRLAALEGRWPVGAHAGASTDAPAVGRSEVANDSRNSPSVARAHAVGAGLEHVLGRWEQVVGAVRRESGSLGSLLQSARPMAVVEGRLSLRFQNAFTLDQFRTARGAEAVERALTSALGLGLRVDSEAAPAAPRAGSEPPPLDPVGPDIRRNPLVNQAAELFPGRLTRVERVGPKEEGAQ